MQKHYYQLWIAIVWCLIVWWISTGAIIRDRSVITHRDAAPARTKIQQSVDTSFDSSEIVTLSGTLFASPKESFDPRKKIISSARWHLDMWMYDITYNRAKLPLVQLAESWLPMRVILEDDKYSSFGNSYIGTKALFEDAGIKMMSDSDLGLWTNYVHAKVFVTPSRAIIQTANLTNGGFNTSREYYVQITDPTIIANLQALFDADWKGEPLDASQIHPNILVCPINCRSTLQSLIRNAHSSIIIQNQYIEDPAIAKLIASKKNITKQIIVADNDFSTGTLASFGEQARILTSPYPHAKMMLIDDRYLVVSSINFSTNSMDNNREIGVIVTNRDAIDYFTTRFTQDRDKAKTVKTYKKTAQVDIESN